MALWVVASGNMLDIIKHINMIVNFCYEYGVKEIFIMKNGVYWDVTPCGSCKNRRFRGT
jgi:hypothetical protein